MGSPASVGNSGMRFKGFIRIWFALFNELLQLGNLSDFLERKDFILFVPVDS